MTAAITREMVAPLVLRRENARRAFIEAVCTLGEIPSIDAEPVFDRYLAAKVLRWNGSAYVVTHGAFMDRAQLRHTAGIRS